MKIYYIANARMPTDKAHGIQIAKMCEAFIENGVEVVLVIPHHTGSKLSLKEYYGLRVDVPVAKLPVLDWLNKGPWLYRISALSFVCSYLWHFYTMSKREDAIVYTIDLDRITYAGFPLLGLPYFSEMHGGKPDSFFYRLFFKKIHGIIATTPITREELMKKFHISEERTLFEPNGVDETYFSTLSKKDARHALGLPLEGILALYVGRVLSWKGIDILPEAARALPGVTLGFLGGTGEGFKNELRVSPEPVVFYGSKPHKDVGVWLRASDVCLVLGTSRDEYSYRYTSPMKIFEYLASGRPIIASRTPALQSVLAEDGCFFFTPDDAKNLAATIMTALSDAAARERMAAKGVALAREHTWSKRAERTSAFIERSLAHSS